MVLALPHYYLGSDFCTVMSETILHSAAEIAEGFEKYGYTKDFSDLYFAVLLLRCTLIFCSHSMRLVFTKSFFSFTDDV